MLDNVKLMKRLEDLVAQSKTGLVAKCRTASLDELREEAGFVRGLETVLRELNQNKEKYGEQP